jgi:Mrp family chromosome partitioning ATPase
MSKNFELMLLAERETEKSGIDAEKRPEHVWVMPARSSDGRGVSMEMDHHSREQVSKLIRHLFGTAGGPRVVALTAVEQGNGCTWMTAQCARTLAAQTSGKICIIDANLHNPALHKYFAVGNDRGLGDALSQLEIKDIREYMSPAPSLPNLSIMTAGSMAGSRSGPLRAEAFAVVLATLRGLFEFILIDTPAISSYSDALGVGQAADGLALIVAEQDTRKKSARHVLKELGKSNVRVLGAVLNKRTFPIPQKIYDKL